MALPALSQTQDNYLFIESAVASLGTFKQYDTSNILFTLDYSDYLTTGETISTVAYSISPATTPPLLVSASTIITLNNVAKQGVSFLLGGGVAGTVYTVTVTATTSLPQTKVDTFQLNVTTQSNVYGGVGYPIGCSSVPCNPCSGTGNDPVREGSAKFLSTRVSVSLNTGIIAPQRSGRHAVTIVNIGTTYCEISHMPFSIGDGTPLGPNAVVTLDTQAAIYGMSQTYIGSVAVMETY
jgi:hypothetical protein